MGRRLRYVPEGGGLVEVTCRTVQGRYLLTPQRDLNRLIVGILARAQGEYPVRLHACVFMSNHYHLLLSVPDARCLARFMNYIQSNVAREAGRLHRWPEKFWGRRYSAILISEEERAQVERLRYILSHGVKEGLTPSPAEWRGVQCVEALLGGTALEGVWIDRTRRYAARNRGENLTSSSYVTIERLELSPLPCWAHLEPQATSRRVRDLLAEIAEIYQREIRLARRRRKDSVLAPHDRPAKLKKACAPWFHCASRKVRRELREAYGWFLAAYREAADKLRQGDLTATFPEGSFPPPMPFVA